MAGLQVNFRLDEDVLVRLDRLADLRRRSRGWLIQEAIAQYLDQELWHAESVSLAITQADSGQTRPISSVMTDVRSYIAQQAEAKVA
jgi:predicted transcriptional regulator